ncbi:MAG: hypothetical protein ABII97_00505 [Patescibacteria group bacterium]
MKDDKSEKVFSPEFWRCFIAWSLFLLVVAIVVFIVNPRHSWGGMNRDCDTYIRIAVVGPRLQEGIPGEIKYYTFPWNSVAMTQKMTAHDGRIFMTSGHTIETKGYGWNFVETARLSDSHKYVVFFFGPNDVHVDDAMRALRVVRRAFYPFLSCPSR